MPSPNFTTEALTFILVFAIPMVAAMWRVFSALTSMRLKLENRIDSLGDLIVALRHDFDLRSQKVDYLEDRYELTLNGLRERIEHVGARTKTDYDRLATLTKDLESYLAKTTPYEPRNRS